MKKMFIGVLSLAMSTISCTNNDDTNNPNPLGNLVLNLNGLEPLGTDFVYEGWIIVNGTPISTGTFSSVAFPQTFEMNAQMLSEATMFVLSIEPSNDPDPAPSATKILAGSFSGSNAEISSSTIVGDFSSSSGSYILATPTDTDDTNEESGVWFLDNSSGSMVNGLNLPVLSEGWKYEGWAVMNGMPISTGTFTNVSGFDDNATSSPFKGDAGNGPAFPGEDYLQNAPTGLTFPTDLRGATIVISVEPDPDNDPAPFTFKPLAHVVPANATVHAVIAMGNGPLQELSGSVSR
ncbi:MAG: anti-sigma factor [Flavobacteriaceae bacterium]